MISLVYDDYIKGEGIRRSFITDSVTEKMAESGQKNEAKC